MNTAGHIEITPANPEQRQAIIALLQSEKLPVEDLPASLDDFFVALHEGEVIGAIGLEKYDNCGLLRSMVVNKAHRNKHAAAQLVQQLENHALETGIDCLYLLTETAPAYFERKGYRSVTRESVPGVLHASAEFSHVCPVSAVVMKKELIANK